MSTTFPMMKCGCAGQATCRRMRGVDYDPPVPACIVHDCIDVAESAPSLVGRTAQCVYFGPHRRRPRNFECNYRKTTGCAPERCRCELPSDPSLPFFEYQGEGSVAATKCKHCGYYETAHANRNHLTVEPLRRCPGYEPRGDVGVDRFFCGCMGWD